MRFSEKYDLVIAGIGLLGPLLSEYLVGGVAVVGVRKAWLKRLEKKSPEKFEKAVLKALSPSRMNKFFLWPSLSVIGICIALLWNSRNILGFGIVGVGLGIALLLFAGFILGSSILPSAVAFYEDFRNKTLLKFLFQEGKQNRHEVLTRIVENRRLPIWRKIAWEMVENPRPWGLGIIEGAIRNGDPQLSGDAVKTLAWFNPQCLQEKIPQLVRSPREGIWNALLESIAKLEPEAADQVLNALDPEQRAPFVEKLDFAREVETSRKMVEMLAQMQQEETYQEDRKKLARLEKLLTTGDANQVRATRFALANLNSESEWKGLLKGWEGTTAVDAQLAIVKHLGPLSDSETRTVLLGMGGQGNPRIKKALAQELGKRKDLNDGIIMELLEGYHPEREELGARLSYLLNPERRQKVMRRLLKAEFMEVRLAVVEALSCANWTPDLLPVLIAAAENDDEPVSLAAIRLARDGNHTELLETLFQLYQQSQYDKYGGKNKSDYAKVLVETIEILIQNAPRFQGPREHLFCTRCHTRTRTEKKQKWEVPVCVKCGTYDHLIPNIRQITGVIGPVQEAEQTSGKVRKFPIWDQDRKSVIPKAIEQLEIRGGGDFDYDWALAAAMELLESRSKQLGAPLPVELIDNPPLSTNSKSLLKTLQSQSSSTKRT